MAIAVTPSGASCGATVRGLDLSKSLAADEIDQVVSVRARGVISGVGDGVFRGGACPTPECGVAGGHRVHRYGGVCTLQP